MLRKTIEIKSSEVGSFRYVNKNDKGLQMANLIGLLKRRKNVERIEDFKDDSDESENQTKVLENDVAETVRQELGKSPTDKNDEKPEQFSTPNVADGATGNIIANRTFSIIGHLN